MLIQDLVDANYRFMDVCVGWPGSVHYARVFAHSSLYKEIEHNKILPNKTISISGTNIPLYMIGNSAYRFLRVAFQVLKISDITCVKI